MTSGSAGLEMTYLAGYPPAVPPQRSTDCSFEWSQAGAYPAFMKGMEGKELFFNSLP